MKAVLEINHVLKPGDFMSIDRYDDGSSVFVVKEVTSRSVIFYGLEISACKDNAYVYEACVPIDDVKFIDNSFVNMKGILWQVAEKVKAGKADEVQTCAWK